MKKMMVLLMALMFVFAMGSMMAVYAGDEFPPGPAPNSHDGIPDGSGWDVPPGPFGPGEPAGQTLSS
ncbi:hypothetical protein ACFLSF_02935 [Candidatus Bipolaricaulota bacterium]